ncbi:MAG: hypothetical protein Q4D25_10950, partial [Bacteroidales bacterium]|nr:hypothetical protein [Bacteroidales bacterium]
RSDNSFNSLTPKEVEHLRTFSSTKSNLNKEIIHTKLKLKIELTMKIKAKDVKAILWILREIITLLLKLKKEDKNNGKKHLDGEGD